ncbi:hypothetical protein C0991_003999 [Blastosporella zonata]|nr:hypothetical protein C0991_003999 [Blastosporella zonata]
MGSRSRRDALSNVESLILAQAVWENGAHAWTAVAKVLSTHSLISRPKSFFTAQASQVMYQNLMQEAGLERTEACDAVHSPINHKLAEKYYRARVRELRELIVIEEEKYKAILSEISAIRAGNFDAEITARITGIPVEPVPAPETKAADPTLNELFEGSDLTGVSATPQSQTMTPAPKATSEARQPDSSLQTPVILDDDPRATVHTTPRQDGGYEQAESDVVDQPSSSPLAAKSTSHPITPKAAEQEEQKHPDVGPQKTQEEEEEDEDDMVNNVAVRAPNPNEQAVEPKEAQPKYDMAEEPPSETLGVNGDKAPEELTSAQEQAPELPKTAPESSVAEADTEVAVDDGESSGEEPLHISRRSTRRRRSTLSPVLPLQTRGKGRRQRPESPITTRGESEPELMEDTEEQEDTPRTDHDASPVPSRRGQEKRQASFVEGIDSPRDKKRPRDDSEPVEEDDAGPIHGRGRRPTGTRSDKRFQAVIGMLHSQISQHRNGNIFHNPIKNSEAPDYHEIVKHPMDLKTIKMRVKDGSIANSQEYQRDIMLMFANAMMYNRPGSDVHTMADDVRAPCLM